MRKLGILVITVLGSTAVFANEAYTPAFELCREAGKLENSNPSAALDKYKEYEFRRDRAFEETPALKTDADVANKERFCAKKKDKILWNLVEPIIDQALDTCKSAEKSFKEDDIEGARASFPQFEAKISEATAVYPGSVKKVTVEAKIKSCKKLPTKIAAYEKQLEAKKAEEAAKAKAAAAAKRKAEQAKQAARKRQLAAIASAKSNLQSCQDLSSSEEINELNTVRGLATSAQDAVSKIRVNSRSADVREQAAAVDNDLSSCIEKLDQQIVKADQKIEEEKQKAALEQRVAKANEDMLSVSKQCNELMQLSGVPESLDFFMVAENEINALLKEDGLSEASRKQLNDHITALDICKKFINQLAPGLF